MKFIDSIVYLGLQRLKTGKIIFYIQATPRPSNITCIVKILYTCDT